MISQDLILRRTDCSSIPGCYRHSHNVAHYSSVQALETRLLAADLRCVCNREIPGTVLIPVHILYVGKNTITCTHIQLAPLVQDAALFWMFSKFRRNHFLRL